MGKYSKEYNIDKKQINLILQKFHKEWKNYNTCLEDLQYANFDVATRKSEAMLDPIAKLKVLFSKSNKRVQKGFIHKFEKKYGRTTPDPIHLLETDVIKLIRSIATRRLYLRQKGLP